MLIVFGGLPGVGKTTLASALARQLNATWLRIDSIEQAIRDTMPGSFDDAGYRVAYAVAADNLNAGRTVVADSVNPLAVTRDAWLSVAQRCNAPALEVEVICSDAAVHRQRVETRSADIPNHRLPTWDEVVSRQYEPWQRNRIVLDTASQTPEQSVQSLLQEIARARNAHLRQSAQQQQQ